MGNAGFRQRGAAKAKHSARKIHEALEAKKIDLCEAGACSHKRGAGRASTLRQAASRYASRTLEMCLASDPAVPLLGISAGKITRDWNRDL